MHGLAIRNHRGLDIGVPDDGKKRRLAAFDVVMIVDEAGVVDVAMVDHHHVPVAGKQEIAVGHVTEHGALRGYGNGTHARGDREKAKDRLGYGKTASKTACYRDDRENG